MEKKGLSLTLTKKPTKVIANKRTMNFAYRESTVNWKKLGIIAAVLVIVLGVFAKFAIIDQLTVKNNAIEARDNAQRRLAKVNAQMADYNKLKTEYDRLTDARMNENERFMVDRVQIFDFIREEIMTRCVVDSVSLRSNDVTLNISDASLAEISALITDLNEHEMVYHIRFTSAHSLDGDVAAINLIVQLQKEGKVNEEA